jgi:hypothetical protein
MGKRTPAQAGPLESLLAEAVKRVGWQTVVTTLLGKALNIAMANGATASQLASEFVDLCVSVEARLEARRTGN